MKLKTRRLQTCLSYSSRLCCSSLRLSKSAGCQTAACRTDSSLSQTNSCKRQQKNLIQELDSQKGLAVNLKLSTRQNGQTSTSREQVLGQIVRTMRLGDTDTLYRVRKSTVKKFMDKRLLVNIQGNRRVTGMLRGFDIFLNIVLDEARDETVPGREENLVGGPVVSDSLSLAASCVQMVNLPISRQCILILLPKRRSCAGTALLASRSSLPKQSLLRSCVQ